MVRDNYAYSTELESICVKVTLDQCSHQHHLWGGGTERACHCRPSLSHHLFLLPPPPFPRLRLIAVLREAVIAGGVVGCPLGLAITGIMGGEWEEEELDSEGITLVIREPPSIYFYIIMSSGDTAFWSLWAPALWANVEPAQPPYILHCHWRHLPTQPPLRDIRASDCVPAISPP